MGNGALEAKASSLISYPIQWFHAFRQVISLPQVMLHLQTQKEDSIPGVRQPRLEVGILRTRAIAHCLSTSVCQALPLPCVSDTIPQVWPNPVKFL